MSHTKQIVVTLAAAALVAAACGGSNTKPSTTKSIGATGGTLQAGSTTLTIPPNALSTSVDVTLREAEPKHSGSSQRIEIEPHGQALAAQAKLSVTVNDQNVKLKLVDDSGNVSNVEVEDRNHNSYKTTMSSLGEVEVEVEHGATCSPACSSTQECDDGVCKAHSEDPSKRSCSTVCDSGQECDDGVCKTHSEVETEHGGTPGTCNPPCATGLECDTTDQVCKAHGGGGSGH
ncbi:MAG TPA: hypothetical protein VFP65_22415 [Anaeromyxobacteraceae bacterium]|nr:hypothetical protein [Anaeromyxobacteraceae bacterium]